MVVWLERYQVPLYIFALVLGALVGLAVPVNPLGAGVNWALALLLYVTFLAVPFRATERLRDVRIRTEGYFLLALLVLNFVFVPVVVFGLTRWIADDAALLFGALLVLLAPCVDYVIVFTRLAGGSWGKVLAATPLLIAVQCVIIPVGLAVFGGETVALSLTWWPLGKAVFWVIAVPMFAAVITQALCRFRVVERYLCIMEATMVPLMMCTLFLVVASQFGLVVSYLGALLRVAAVYVGFVLVMTPIAGLVSHWWGFSAADRRALVFSSVTRNSLVVLPLALAFPGPVPLAGLAVVTQTLVELLAMISFVRVLPKLIVDC